IQDSEQSYQPSALIYVVEPAYISFVVLSYTKWVLETGRNYEICLEIFDSSNHKIYPSDNLLIEALFPLEFFKVNHQTKNGSYFHVTTLKKGVVSIRGSLKGVLSEKKHLFVPALMTEQLLEIYDKIEVEPECLLFPWEPNTKFSYSSKLTATGGSGEYSWNSHNLSVATVNNKGYTSPVSLGISRIVAADVKNHRHTGTAKVAVLPPTKIKLLPSKVEAEINTKLLLPVAMFAEFEGTEKAFEDCRHLNLSVKFSDKSSFDLISDHAGSVDAEKTSCTSIQLLAKQPGSCQITVTYQGSHKVLRATLTVAAYKPLMAENSISIVTLGSTKDILFSGGPQPWQLDPTGYFEDLIPSANFVSFSHLSGIEYSLHRGLHAFQVVCVGLGEQTLKLKVGNKPTHTNRQPVVVETFVKFVCAEPVSLHLQPQVSTISKRSELPPCPVFLDSNQVIPVHCKQNLTLLLTVTDNQGRKFDNFSSLKFDWELSDTSLASLSSGEQPINIETDVSAGKLAKVSAVGYQVVAMYGKPGIVIVTVSCQHYISRYLSHYRIPLHSQLQGIISQSLELNLVDGPSIKPESLSIFNHPSNKAYMKINKGSGYFHVESVPTSFVDVRLINHNNTIQVIPRLDGMTKVKVHDLCLDLPSPPSTTVQVSGVGYIHLYIIDKVELGKDITAKVNILDINGKPLLAKFYYLMNVTLATESDILSVQPSPNDKSDSTEAEYLVKGLRIGHTTLTCSAVMESGETIYSKTKPIEVFPPFRLRPRSLTLIIGAFYQILATGGPRTQGSVEFSMENSARASISNIGLVEALELGSTKLIGQAVGLHPDTNEPVVYSEDTIDVYVLKLSGVKIHSPLTQLKTGTLMPLFAVGITDNVTPFSFGSAIPALSFSWTVSNSKVAKLQSVYHETGLNLPRESNFATHLVAVSAGIITVQLRVKPTVKGKNQIVLDKEFRDELQIEVFDGLALISPSMVDGYILVTANTETQLKTNRDNSVRLLYKTSSRPGEKAAEVKVRENGILSTGSKTGQVTLMVSAVEDFGINQTMIFNVIVKPVSFLRLSVDTVFKLKGGSLSALPLGATLSLRVSFHDEIGHTFHATNIQTRFTCNRYDLLQVFNGAENNTLVIKTTNVGQTLLKVWNSDDRKLADYINIPVKQAIVPQTTTMKFGQIFCFDVPLTSSKGMRGMWASSRRTISIHEDTGVAIATNIGKSHVTFNMSSDLNIVTEVVVEPIHEIFLENTTSFISNVGHQNKLYLFLVKLANNKGFIGANCPASLVAETLSKATFPFFCHVELTNELQDITAENLFSVHPDFDENSGNFVCKLTVESKNLGLSLTTLISNVIVHATIPSEENQGTVSAISVPLPFYPSFHIHSLEIYLSNANPQSTLRLSTIPSLFEHILVTASDPSFLEVLPPQPDTSTSAIVYLVRLRETSTVWERLRTDLYVDFSSPLTGQHVHIPVYIRLIDSKQTALDSKLKDHSFTEVTTSQTFWFLILLFITAFFLILALAYQIRYGVPRVSDRPDVFLQHQYNSSTPLSSPSVLKSKDVQRNRYQEDTPMSIRNTSPMFNRSFNSSGSPYHYQQSRSRANVTHPTLWSVEN
ncbi:nuclear pore membrane glycoprotein 210-like isoform X1, partial [Argonauta hians]